MAISYEEIKSYYDKRESPTRRLLYALEEDLILGRDKESVPIYLTKSRIKTINSIYLKTKRTNNDKLEEITDYGGFRILCLFEQDLFKVHHYLITILKKDSDLVKFKVHNWPLEKDSEKFVELARQNFKNVFIEKKSKRSGYKSFHYIINQEHKGKTYPMEIQLRTLLQDVWGELEHALAYKKGNIHTHIRTSFLLLAKDLENKDEFMTHLHKINEIEVYNDNFERRNAGPYKFFKYDALPESILKNEAYNIYEEHVKNGFPNNNKEWLSNARKYYDDVVGSFSALDHKKNTDVNYFIEMENAFLLFSEGKLEDALEKYMELAGSPKRKYYYRYVAHFRMGEIYWITGEIVEALKEFDMCERILERPDEHNLFNEYLIKVKLAITYWQLGEDYYEIAIEKIAQAEKIFLDNKNLFEKINKINLINNLCWYNLEGYLKNKERDDYREVALKNYKELEALLIEDNELITSDIIDTAAWCCYQFYLDSQDIEWLKKANMYCEKLWNNESNTYTNIKGIEISSFYKRRTQEIQQAFKKVQI